MIENQVCGELSGCEFIMRVHRVLHCNISRCNSNVCPDPCELNSPARCTSVTSRGDRREAIYLEDADRQQWLHLFGEVCQRFNWLCHAYCLMDKHLHIASGNHRRQFEHDEVLHCNMRRCNSNACPDPCELNFPALCTTLPRGDRRVAIYLDDADRQQWLLLFG